MKDKQVTWEVDEEKLARWVDKEYRRGRFVINLEKLDFSIRNRRPTTFNEIELAALCKEKARLTKKYQNHRKRKIAFKKPVCRVDACNTCSSRQLANHRVEKAMAKHWRVPPNVNIFFTCNVHDRPFTFSISLEGFKPYRIKLEKLRDLVRSEFLHCHDVRLPEFFDISYDDDEDSFIIGGGLSLRAAIVSGVTKFEILINPVVKMESDDKFDFIV